MLQGMVWVFDLVDSSELLSYSFRGYSVTTSYSISISVLFGKGEGRLHANIPLSLEVHRDCTLGRDKRSVDVNPGLANYWDIGLATR